MCGRQPVCRGQAPRAGHAAGQAACIWKTKQAQGFCIADLVSQPVQQLGLDLALVALHSPSLLSGAGLWLLVRGLRLARGPRGAWGCCSCGCCRVVDAYWEAAAGCGWLAWTGLSKARWGTACMQLWGCIDGSA